MFFSWLRVKFDRSTQTHYKNLYLNFCLPRRHNQHQRFIRTHTLSSSACYRKSPTVFPCGSERPAHARNRVVGLHDTDVVRASLSAATGDFRRPESCPDLLICGLFYPKPLELFCLAFVERPSLYIANHGLIHLDTNHL